MIRKRHDEDLRQRDEVRAFLRATSGLPWRIYQAMPDGWTQASRILPRLKQGSRSTALATLRRAGAVDTIRSGRIVFYRPKPHFYVRALASRKRGGA